MIKKRMCRLPLGWTLSVLVEPTLRELVQKLR